LKCIDIECSSVTVFNLFRRCVFSSFSVDAEGVKRHAMYGGMTEPFTERLVQRMRLVRNQTFLDIGSGIGQVVLQVAATVGCKAIGIEISALRHRAAKSLVEHFDAVLEKVSARQSLAFVYVSYHA
jgi:SAM-dependent methyltransferase